ncbi:hypothetical protein H6Y62_00860 [Staphylococcus lugdunensis]|uniref:Uncharacterized protein n=1 Tax=Staphylococcus lugdunensis TaxID=28035 RepID=A0A4Q9WBB2_STALU|nr:MULTISPECIES: DUF6583 family protein [Staphylococcus]HDM3615856.1 hypothetical protein [Staphylococcus aureus]AMG61814.1 hypothetical protein AL499_07630 [Staphylococcus lugdunensis]ARJ10327.1 hypothetical protein B7466_00665 [Staphylococcus lugdunensis]AST61205.1 hypothetical protein BFP67_10535 [Staphylococcus lugdunensis]ATG70063.1 hypothetical protein CPG32_10720 [Staphylococcus lugdunensis]
MSKKLKIIISAVVILLIVAGIGFGAYKIFSNTPKNTYLLSEQKTAKKFQNYFNHRFDNEVKFQEKMKDNSYLSNMSLSADASKELIESMGLPKSVIDATKITASIGHDDKNTKSLIKVNPTIADKEVGNFQWAADKNFQYFTAPLFKGDYKVKNSELVKQYAEISGEDEEQLKSSGVTNQSLNLNTLLGSTQTQQKDVDTIIKRYTDIVFDHLKDDNFKKEGKEEVKVDGETEKANKVTLKLDRADTKKLTLAILKKAKDDKELQSLVKNQMSKDEYKKQIEDALKKAEDAKEKEFIEFTSTIYEKHHEILKRDITLTDKDNKKVKIVGNNSITDDKLALDYKFTTDDGSFSLKGKSTGKDDNYKDKYDATFDNNYNKSTLTFENKEKQDGTKRHDKGTITFDNAGTKQDFTFDNSLDTDVKNNQQKQKLTVGIKLQDEPINFILNSDTKLKADISFDTDKAKDIGELSSKELDKLDKEISKNGEKLLESIIKKVTDD